MSEPTNGSIVGWIRRNWWIVPVIATVAGSAVGGVKWAASSLETLRDEIDGSRQFLIERLDDHSATVRAELATQTQQLTFLASTQSEQFIQREGRFEEQENEHKRIIDAVYETLGDFHFEAGKHVARHEADENSGRLSE